MTIQEIAAALRDEVKALSGEAEDQDHATFNGTRLLELADALDAERDRLALEAVVEEELGQRFEP